MSDVASDDLGTCYASPSYAPIEPADRFESVLRLAGTRAATAADLPQVLACLGIDPVDCKRRLEKRRWRRKLTASQPDRATRRSLIAELRRRELARLDEGCPTCGEVGAVADYPCRTKDGRKAHQTHVRRAS